MKPRNTLIAFLLLIAVGSYLYFVEIRGAKKREAKEEQEKKLFSLKEDDIQSITLAHQQKTITISREKSGFRIVSPVETAADPYATKDLAEAVVSLAREALVVEEPEGKDPYKPFGLDPPETRISFKNKGGKESAVLVGTKNPVGDSYYARIEGEPAVFLVKGGSATALKKDLFSLRNKKLLDFQQDDVKELEIVHGEDRVALKRRKGRWYETAPATDLARAEKIRSLLGTLEYLEASSFPDDEGKDLSGFGLDTPQVTVRLKLETGSAIQTLLVGDKVPGEEKVYVKRAEDPSVAVVGAAILKDSQGNGEAFQEDRAFAFDRWGAAALTIEKDGKKRFTITKNDDGQYDVKPHPGKKVEADWQKVDDFLKQLAEVKIAGRTETSAASFDKPTLRLTVTEGKNGVERSFLVKVREGAPSLVKDPDRATILELPSQALDSLLSRKAEDFVKQQPKAEEESKATDPGKKEAS